MMGFPLLPNNQGVEAAKGLPSGSEEAPPDETGLDDAPDGFAALLAAMSVMPAGAANVIPLAPASPPTAAIGSLLKAGVEGRDLPPITCPTVAAEPNLSQRFNRPALNLVSAEEPNLNQDGLAATVGKLRSGLEEVKQLLLNPASPVLNPASPERRGLQPAQDQSAPAKLPSRHDSASQDQTEAAIDSALAQPSASALRGADPERGPSRLPVEGIQLESVSSIVSFNSTVEQAVARVETAVLQIKLQGATGLPSATHSAAVPEAASTVLSAPQAPVSITPIQSVPAPPSRFSPRQLIFSGERRTHAAPQAGTAEPADTPASLGPFAQQPGSREHTLVPEDSLAAGGQLPAESGRELTSKDAQPPAEPVAPSDAALVKVSPETAVNEPFRTAAAPLFLNRRVMEATKDLRDRPAQQNQGTPIDGADATREAKPGKQVMPRVVEVQTGGLAQREGRQAPLPAPLPRPEQAAQGQSGPTKATAPVRETARPQPAQMATPSGGAEDRQGELPDAAVQGDASAGDSGTGKFVPVGEPHGEINVPRREPAPAIQQTIGPLLSATDALPRREAHTLRLNLKPIELGGVEIRLSRDAAGRLSAHFTAERADTSQSLAAGIVQLRETLERAGVTVDRLDVSAQPASNFNLDSQSGGTPPRQHQPVPVRSAVGPELPEQPADTAATPAVVADRLLNLRA